MGGELSLEIATDNGIPFFRRHIGVEDLVKYEIFQLHGKTVSAPSNHP